MKGKLELAKKKVSFANGAHWFHAKKQNKNAPEVDDSEYFNNLNYHRLTTEQIIKLLDTSYEIGLDTITAAKRLQQYGPNVLLQHSSNYVWKILGYVFGQFCSVLWVGVVVFLLCWQPLSTPPIVPDGVPDVQNLALAILVVCKNACWLTGLQFPIQLSLVGLRHISAGVVFSISRLVNFSGHEIDPKSTALRMYRSEKWTDIEDFSQPTGTWRHRTC